MIRVVSLFILTLGIAMGGGAFFVGDNTLMLVAFHLIWISNMLYVFGNISKRFIFGVFNLTFFLFIMGRITMNFLFYGNYGLEYSEEIIFKVFVIIFMGLFLIRLFYMLFENRRQKSSSIRIVHIRKALSRIDKSLFEKACLHLYWITLLFAAIYVFERIIFVQASSYASYYTGFETQLPGIFAKAYKMNELFFFFYLASNPKKKSTVIPILSFLIIGILCLGYGQRNPIALRFCTIFLIYIPLREISRENGEETWITKRYKRGVILTIPLFILFLSFWGAYRLRVDSHYSIGEWFISFFDTQGNSAKILAEMIKDWDMFPKGKIYSLCPITEFLTNNFIFKAIKGSGYYYGGFTVESAMNGVNFGNTISYLYSPSHYLKGVGLGTCYLAEVYKDFGFLGITIISAIYSWLMIRVMSSYNKSLIGAGIGLIFMYSLIYAPRDCAMSFLGEIFSFTFIAAIAFMYMYYLILKSRASFKNDALSYEKI